MLRRPFFVSALCLSVWCLGAAVSALPAQNPDRGRDRLDRARDREFGLSADDWCREDNNRRSRSFCDVREDTITGVDLVDVDTGGNGSIRVRGSNRTDVHLRTRITAHARSEADARDLSSDVRVTTTGGRVRVDGPRSRDNEYWTVTFELEVPRRLQLQLNTTNGGLALETYEGKAVLRTVNGGIALSSVGGDIRGNTVNGGVSVDLDGRKWDGQGLDVETRNGGVTMSLPSDYSAELEIGTINGGLTVDFPMVVQGRLTRLDRHITTTIGSGGPRLRAVTTNGGVRVGRR